MRRSSRTALVWSAGVVALAASGAAGLVLLALPASSAVIVTGGMTAAALGGWLAAQLQLNRAPARTPEQPVPSVPNPDSLTRNADRLRLLESAVIHAHDAIVVMAAEPKDGAGRSVLYVNDAFCQMTGYDRSEVVGRSLHFLRGPDSDKATLDRIRESLDACRPFRVELRNYRKDGSGYWVDLSLVPVPDEHGRATHWVMIQRDITDNQAAGDALRRSEERYRLLFDSNPHPMWVFEPRHTPIPCRQRRGDPKVRLYPRRIPPNDHQGHPLARGHSSTTRHAYAGRPRLRKAHAMASPEERRLAHRCGNLILQSHDGRPPGGIGSRHRCDRETATRRATAASAKNGSDRPDGRRRRARFQQSSHRHYR